MKQRFSPLPVASFVLIVLLSGLGASLHAGPGNAFSHGRDGRFDDSGDSTETVALASDPIRSSPSAGQRSSGLRSGVWERGFAGLAVPSNYYASAGNGLVIEGLDFFPDNRLMVFDSTGKRVYAQRGYANGWSGTDREGNRLPSGRYFILIEVDGLGDDVQSYLNLVW